MSLPRFVRVRCIRHLARITADAFKVPAPDIRGPWIAALDAYAGFTAGEARRVLACGLPLEPVQMRLFSSARDLGSRLRTGLLIRSPRRAASVLRALYRMIGVDFHASGCRFRVASCYFSTRYTPEICQLISSLDRGLYSGLSDGGQLEFHERITEGAAFCGGTLRAGAS